jgi:hypothetical protein
MYKIATMARGPKAAIFSGVKADTTDEKIKAGRPTFWGQYLPSEGSSRLTREMKPTPFAN